jgi:hypothetical protein
MGRRKLMQRAFAMTCVLAAGGPVAAQVQSSARQPLASYRPVLDPFAWDRPLVDGVDVVFVDQQTPPLTTTSAAGGPVQRFAARPGAWYAVVFLPLQAQVPVQAWLWHRRRTHEVRVTALNAAPWSQPTISVPIAVRAVSSAGGAVFVSSPFALPATTSADGVFLLIEQWSASGTAPGPLWVQIRSRSFYGANATPWWSTRAEGPIANEPLARGVPPSPLSTSRSSDSVLELPIQWRRASNTLGDSWGAP